jgi:hypothetical protein
MLIAQFDASLDGNPGATPEFRITINGTPVGPQTAVSLTNPSQIEDAALTVVDSVGITPNTT